MDDGTGDWKPPSEAELKIIQARRERSEKISQIMGSYLLKGYRMLDSVCDVCETVLLRDSQQQLYCVACSEVDNEHSKDNPAVSGEAAKKQIAESQFSESENVVSSREAEAFVDESEHRVTIPEITPAISSTNEASTSAVNQIQTNSENEKEQDSVAQAIHTIEDKMAWACQNFSENTSISGCTKWCKLLKICAETLIVLNQAQNFKNKK